MKQGPASLGSSRKIGQNDFAKIPGYLGGRFEEPINNTDIRFFLLKFSLESDVQATKEKLLAIFKTNSHVITLREMLNLVPGDLKHSLDRLAAISLIHQNGLGPNSQKQFETVEELNAAMTEYFLLLYPIQLPKLEDGFALVKGIQSTFEIPEHLQNKELKELRKYLQGMNSNEACILSTQFLSRIGVALGLAKSLNLANHQELLPFILSMRQMVSPIIKSTAILVRENVKHLHPAGPQNGELILMSLGQFGLGDGLGLLNPSDWQVTFAFTMQLLMNNSLSVQQALLPSIYRSLEFDVNNEHSVMFAMMAKALSMMPTKRVEHALKLSLSYSKMREFFATDAEYLKGMTGVFLALNLWKLQDSGRYKTAMPHLTNDIAKFLIDLDSNLKLTHPENGALKSALIFQYHHFVDDNSLQNMCKQILKKF